VCVRVTTGDAAAAANCRAAGKCWEAGASDGAGLAVAETVTTVHDSAFALLDRFLFAATADEPVGRGEELSLEPAPA